MRSKDSHHRPLVVGIGGALRPRSSTEAALRIVLHEARKLGARTELITGEALIMPLYSVADIDQTSSRHLVETLRMADGIVIGSPGYHGSLSGAVKNALDYTEALRVDCRPYFDGRAVGCIASAGGMQAAVQTLNTLRGIVHALRGWPTPLGIAFNSSDVSFDWGEHSVTCSDDAIQSQLESLAIQVMRFSADGAFPGGIGAAAT